jgi:hypothetical protein
MIDNKLYSVEEIVNLIPPLGSLGEIDPSKRLTMKEIYGLPPHLKNKVLHIIDREPINLSGIHYMTLKEREPRCYKCGMSGIFFRKKIIQRNCYLKLYSIDFNRATNSIFPVLLDVTKNDGYQIICSRCLNQFKKKDNAESFDKQYGIREVLDLVKRSDKIGKKFFVLLDEDKIVRQEDLFGELDGSIYDFSHIKYQLYLEKGTDCVSCGLKGQFFLRGFDTTNKSYTLSLFGVNDKKLISITKDHIVPLSEGGFTKITNLQVMCEPCNNLKGNKTSYFDRIEDNDNEL